MDGLCYAILWHPVLKNRQHCRLNICSYWAKACPRLARPRLDTVLWFSQPTKLWKLTKNHDKPWNHLKKIWKPTKNQPKTMKLPWKPWKPAKNHEKSWNYLEKPWEPTKNHDQQGGPTDLLCSKKRDVTDMGPQLTSFGPKNVMSLTGGSNWPPLVQKRDRHQQGGPTDLLWSKNVTVTNRGG